MGNYRGVTGALSMYFACEPTYQLLLNKQYVDAHKK
ncbi:hypothetical protein GGR02_000673 [Anoxybacillus voinovskiensis]|uniref:Uncharacterized protein n=1 Tax=Anoxybacteroides voinovskiense TaxID=230470 RepID=A0A840DMK1_9BACL|nr:hypothetical protein [Anoxybacillus voinovskiensis]